MTSRDSAELRKRMLDQTAAKAEQDFSDTRFDWLRTRSARRRSVLLTFAVLLAYGFGVYNDWPITALVALLTYFGMIFVLRTSVRGVTDYPDELVDERMREERGHAYRLAFIGTMALSSLYLIMYIGNQLLAKAGSVSPMTADQLHDSFFVFFFASMILPSAIYAWTQDEFVEAAD